jgi:hypothetical protein
MIWSLTSHSGKWYVWQGDEMSQLPDDMPQTIEGSMEFDNYDQIVTYFKSLEGEHSIRDLDCYGMIDINSGTLVGYTSEWGNADAYLRKKWNQIPESEYDDEPAPDCRLCGDGGCPSCRPSWFL